MSDIHVRLPDGRTLAVSAGASVLEVAGKIGPRLAKDAIAGRVAGRLVDLRSPVEDGAAVEIVTSRDPVAAEVMRHSAEHVMADAVKRLFPDAQVDVGRTDHAEKFQYDFLVAKPFTPEDLEKIEAEMKKIVAEDAPFTREVVTREEARALFASLGEELKLSRLADIPEGQPITIYRHGKFADLCRGPHVQRASQIGAVKLLEAAGAYWRGNEANPMLQRIYGTAFASQRDLDLHLERIEEAKRRDHRRVGPELGLFHLDPIAPGSPFYLPKGMIVYNGLVDFMKSLYPKYGYQEVMGPQVVRSDLFKTSGHYYEFKEDMFWVEGDEGEELGIKPMNCPGHCKLFSLSKRSYRELPLRYAEFSRLHRNERSGALTGLARVRAMAQDDGHIFCEPEQVEDEVRRFFEMMNETYRALGLTGIRISVSTRPERFLGEPADWDKAEQMLIHAVKQAGYECGIKPGEAAFYAPKVECDFDDVLGRSWTLATFQWDMALPGRFGLRYIGRDGGEHQPAMFHRAILGSLERFLALYLEHTGGDFPLWLAPVQVVVATVTDRAGEYARRVRDTLMAAGVRAELDDRSEKLGFKVREAELQKVPIVAVIGDQETQNETVTLRRRRDKNRGAVPVPLGAFAEELRTAIAARQA
jgi:threonyl-tRNA synthetase